MPQSTRTLVPPAPVDERALPEQFRARFLDGFHHATGGRLEVGLGAGWNKPAARR